MFVALLLIMFVNQSARGSPFNFPDESDSRKSRDGEMVMPGIYFDSAARSGKSLDTVDLPAAISFGSSEPVRLPSLTSIMFTSRDDQPKQDDPKPVHAISFGENPNNVAIGFNDGTADKSEGEGNVPMLFLNKPKPAEIVDRENNIPVPASFDVPVMNEFSNLENEMGHILKSKFPVVIVIDGKPLPVTFHFINTTNHNQTIGMADSTHGNRQDDDNLIQTSSESPAVLFFNPQGSESNDSTVGSTNNFMFPTPRTDDVTEDGQGDSVILDDPVSQTCESDGYMMYNDTCYRLLTSGPCANGSWLISKDGRSAECEKRKCAVNETLFNNSCIDIDTPKICPEGFMLNINQSGIGNCQCKQDGQMSFQGNCYRFLTSGPCGIDNWLTLRYSNNKYDAECAPIQCPEGEIFYNNKCVDPANSTVCGEGQMLYVELTGEAFCDCEPDYIYILDAGKCIPEYERGYCNWSEYIVRNEEEIPECVPNPCGQDGSVYVEGDNRCYEKKYIGFCKEEHIIIKGEEAECGEIDTRNIFEVPTLRRCPRGSARDILHECRRRVAMPSMSSVLSSKHLYGGCKPGWTRGRDGRCKIIRNMFGK